LNIESLDSFTAKQLRDYVDNGLSREIGKSNFFPNFNNCVLLI